MYNKDKLSCEVCKSPIVIHQFDLHYFMAEKVGILLLHAFKRCAENGLTVGSKEMRGKYSDLSNKQGLFSLFFKFLRSKVCISQLPLICVSWTNGNCKRPR